MSTQLPCPASGLPASLKSAVALRLAESHSPLARLRAGDALELYYEVGDPHSQLCAAVARKLIKRLQIPLRIRLVPAPLAASYPEADRQRQFAILDGQRLAPAYQLPTPQTVPPGEVESMQNRLAAAGDHAERFLQIEASCLQELKAKGKLQAGGPEASSLLQANAKRRRALGHYLPAMWQFRGEWFWGLDRLTFLEQKLRQVGVLTDTDKLASRSTAALDTQADHTSSGLDFWFSFRSPYSYLAATHLLRNPDIFPPARLRIRPVLPMVMRGLPVPREKRLYIVRDVKRCADAQNIAFGRIHDPVGDGVMRLLTVFPHDAPPQTQLMYCVVAGQSIWAEGLNTRKDKVLQSIFERCELDWPTAHKQLHAGYDTRAAEAHREALFAAGLWGVPSFKLGSFVTWGQDRLWMIEHLLRSAPSA